MLGVCCFSELLELEHPYKTFCCIFLPGIGELEIFVKIVKTVEEIPKFSAQQSQHISVTRKFFLLTNSDFSCLPVLRGKLYKEKSHSLEKFICIASKCSEGFLGHLSQKLFRIDLENFSKNCSSRIYTI